MNKAFSNTLYPTLVIFCKRPLLGQGKSRLAAGIGKQGALLIAEKLVVCALEDSENWPGAVVLTVSNKCDANWAAAQFPSSDLILTQTEGNLGQRINAIDETLRELGHERLVFIGTDAPVLNTAHYVEVITKLNVHEFVFSPAEDGGVTIMANTKPWPCLSHLPWSTSRLGQDLMDLVGVGSPNNIAVIPTTFDIDERNDLVKASRVLSEDMREGRRALCSSINATLYQSV